MLPLSSKLDIYKYLCYSLYTYKDIEVYQELAKINKELSTNILKMKNQTIGRSYLHKNSSVSYNILCHEKEIIVSFRGPLLTNSLKDNDPIFQSSSLTNPFRNYPKITISSNDIDEVKILKIEIEENKKKIYLHSGFVSLFNIIYDNLAKELQPIILNSNKIKRIVFSGHSTGAALARIAYITFILKYPDKFPIFFVFSYASPKIGNKVFEKFIQQTINDHGLKSFITNVKDDIIPYLPPKQYGFSKPFTIYTLDNKDIINLDHHSIIYYLNCIDNIYLYK